MQAQVQTEATIRWSEKLEKKHEHNAALLAFGNMAFLWLLLHKKETHTKMEPAQKTTSKDVEKMKCCPHTKAEQNYIPCLHSTQDATCIPPCYALPQHSGNVIVVPCSRPSALLL